MSPNDRPCPDCNNEAASHSDRLSRVSRRNFLQATGAVALAGGTLPGLLRADDKPAAAASPESLVKTLYESLNETQKKSVCFDWDHKSDELGLLRTHVSANWHITKPEVKSEFFTGDQQAMIRKIFEGMVEPEWHAKFDQQLTDDAGGFGKQQNIAIFGTPGGEKFEFVLTGRHMTMRCDGNSAEHVAFGGPIFYGHAASGFNEKPTHPGNVFWQQAIVANDLYKMLDGKQQKMALVEESPYEYEIGFGGEKGERHGISVTEMSADQKEHLQKVLGKLLEPYRKSDRDEALACIQKQGGLDKCNLAFYQDADVGKDGVWDNWRLEGPALVWYFRGNPHVHAWVNISADPSVETNSA